MFYVKMLRLKNEKAVSVFKIFLMFLDLTNKNTKNNINYILILGKQ